MSHHVGSAGGSCTMVCGACSCALMIRYRDLTYIPGVRHTQAYAVCVYLCCVLHQAHPYGSHPRERQRLWCDHRPSACSGAPQARTGRQCSSRTAGPTGITAPAAAGVGGYFISLVLDMLLARHHSSSRWLLNEPCVGFAAAQDCLTLAAAFVCRVY